MKKTILLGVTILMLGLGGCSSSEESKLDNDSSDNKPNKIELTDEENKEIIEILNMMCEDTVYDGAKFDIVTELQEDYTKNNNVLKLQVTKDRTEVETYFRLNGASNDVKESIKKSLTLDTAVEAANDEVEKINEFDRVIAVLYSSEEDLKNGNSYCVDELEIEK